MGTARPDPAAAAMAAHVVVLLDRSGSMVDGVDGYISGFNAFVDAQRAAGARVSLYLFDERAERVLDCVPAADVPPLTRATYRLGGSTALYDAIGAALALALGGPPGVCAVLTDGQDNASRTHTRDSARAAIAAAEAEGWTFAFLAANRDAFDAVSGLAAAGLYSVFDPQASAEAFDTMNEMVTELVTRSNTNGSAP